MYIVHSASGVLANINTDLLLPFLLDSISAANNLAYLLARDALHTLATTARQASPGVAGAATKFEDPSRGIVTMGELSSEASSQVSIPS